MNKKMEEMLRLAASNGINCAECPVREKCDEIYGKNNTPDDDEGCFELFIAYVENKPMPQMSEYTVDVRFIGHKKYTIRARSSEEAELKAIDVADYRDVEDWDRDYCAE